MIANIVALIITVFFSLLLGMAVVRRAPDRPVNNLYGLNTIAVALWASINYLIIVSNNAAATELYVRLANAASVFVIATYVDFILVFPGVMVLKNHKSRYILYSAAILAAITTFIPDFISSINLDVSPPHVEFGPVLVFFGLLMGAMLFYANFKLIQKCIHLRGLQRVQAIYVLWGILGTQIFSVTVAVILPMAARTTAYASWAPVGYLATMTAMAYAIAKYQLLDFSMAGRRFIAHMLAVLVLGLPAIFIYRFTIEWGDRLGHIGQFIPWVLWGIVVGFGFTRVSQAFQEFLDRSLGNRMEVLSELFSSTAEAMVRTTNISEVCDQVAREIHRFMGVEEVRIYVENLKTQRYQCLASSLDIHPSREGKPQSAPEPFWVTSDHALVNNLLSGNEIIYRDQILRFSPLALASELLSAMQELRCEAATAMHWGQELVGFITLGPKNDGGMFRHDELILCANLGAQLALAVMNGRLYEEVVTAKEYNENIIREMESALVVADTQGIIQLANPAAEKILGLDVTLVRGAGLSQLPEPLAGALEQQLRSSKPMEIQRMEVLVEDYAKPVSCITFALHGANGQVQGAATIVHDLSALEELDRERREADRLRVLRTISAGMAHEIRNPLVAIRTFAELAPLRLEDPEFRSEFLSVAQSEIARIEDLVTQLLAFSKPMSVERKPVALNDLVNTVVRSVSAAAQTSKVNVMTELETHLPSPMGDVGRLQQALMNLILNAIEATPLGGEVLIRTLHIKREEETGSVQLRIWNSGSYIPPHELKEVFEPFFTRKPQGTGLGLAICQTIVEEHFGQIWATSDHVLGTEFFIELPVENNSKTKASV